MLNCNCQWDETFGWRGSSFAGAAMQEPNVGPGENTRTVITVHYKPGLGTTPWRMPGRCAQDTWSSSAAQSYRGSGVPRLLGTGDAGSPRWALPGPEDPRQFCGLAHIFPFPELACLTRRDKLASRFRRDRFLLEFSQRPIWYRRSSEILKFHFPISFADFRSVEYQSESISQAWPAPLIFH